MIFALASVLQAASRQKRAARSAARSPCGAVMPTTGRITPELSGGKRSDNEDVHLQQMKLDLGTMRSWHSDRHTGSREGGIVIYVFGATPAGFSGLWDLYKDDKAAAGADAKTFSSWYINRLLETCSPQIEVTVLRGKLEGAVKVVEDAKLLVESFASKFEKLGKFEGLVAAELVAWKEGKIKKPSDGQPCGRGCGRSFTNAGAKAAHEKACDYVRDETEEPEDADDKIEPKSVKEWLQLATDHGVPQTLVSKKVRGAGGFQDRGWAASANAAAVAYRAELEAEQKAVGTEDAAEDAAKDAAGDAFYAIVKALKAHELAACRGLGVQELEDRLRPRAKKLAAHWSAIHVKRGRANVASGGYIASLAKATKALQASRLGQEYRATGYVPHNNDTTTQADRRAEGIYDGADLYAVLTGIGQP
jgi:hypothetical protein